ncbi:MAG: AMP-binding protein [Actinobacteria bacterium]|nr:AMP-binding protein [Actinomycetota bacterium]
MWPGAHARTNPDKPAYVMASTGQVVTYQELDDRSNRLAQLFHAAGLRFGDHIAIAMENHPRYLEVVWAAQRSGLYFTPINFHFNAEEIAYIVDNCDAQAYVTSAHLSESAAALRERLPERCAVRLMLDRPAGFEGYDDYDTAIAAFPAEPLDEELEGVAMVYSSGTTGRPKGIKYANPRRAVGEPLPGFAGFGETYGLDEHTVYLSPAPLYHSAPLQFCVAMTRFGGTAIVLERFDPELALASIEKYRVTHSQWVPTMFVRMLKLPDETRRMYDVSSQQLAIHAAAPCPVPIKQQMIEWWGPIIFEYYAATEGGGSTMITSEEWLAHPGSVGKPFGSNVHILDEEGNPLPPGESGVVWFEGGERSMTFEYHKDPEKTKAAHSESGWTTVGDMGYLDDEGYLYLTDRRDFMIVSGGVNIYPQEAENLLITHPKVMDAAVFGVPNEEMGEEVKGVVQPIDWSTAGPELEAELVAFCRDNLAHYKCPVSIDFMEELPRQPTGKLYKRLIRDRYWGDRTSRIV